MAKNTLIRELEQYVELHRDPTTGIAWVENGKTGNGHSCHPNIDRSGSVRGMKKLYWGQNAVTVRCKGFIYNTSRISVSDKYDQIAADECRCEICRTRRIAV